MYYLASFWWALCIAYNVILLLLKGAVMIARNTFTFRVVCFVAMVIALSWFLGSALLRWQPFAHTHANIIVLGLGIAAAIIFAPFAHYMLDKASQTGSKNSHR